jgi:hypothetical protein
MAMAKVEQIQPLTVRKRVIFLTKGSFHKLKTGAQKR